MFQKENVNFNKYTFNMFPEVNHQPFETAKFSYIKKKKVARSFFCYTRIKKKKRKRSNYRTYGCVFIAGFCKVAYLHTWFLNTISTLVFVDIIVVFFSVGALVTFYQKWLIFRAMQERKWEKSEAPGACFTFLFPSNSVFLL